MDYHHFNRKGVDFVGYVEPDNDGEAPWDMEDGHGPVRVMTHRLDGRKRPGERVIHQDGHTVWLYDWQKACAIARADGWNAEPFDAPNQIERAVTADFNYLQRWLQGEWHYVGVCVRRATDSPKDRYNHALWGIESGDRKTITEVMDELADQILEE